MSSYRRDFDKTNKCMSFLIKDEKMLEKYNDVWEKSLQNYPKRI